MMTHCLHVHVAGNLPIKTLVARTLTTSMQFRVPWYAGKNFTVKWFLFHGILHDFTSELYIECLHQVIWRDACTYMYFFTLVKKCTFANMNNIDFKGYVQYCITSSAPKLSTE